MSDSFSKILYERPAHHDLRICKPSSLNFKEENQLLGNEWKLSYMEETGKWSEITLGNFAPRSKMKKYYQAKKR